jgi:hypothetical protein
MPPWNHTTTGAFARFVEDFRALLPTDFGHQIPVGLWKLALALCTSITRESGDAKASALARSITQATKLRFIIAKYPQDSVALPDAAYAQALQR